MSNDPLETRKTRTRAWFESLRDDICSALEAVEAGLPDDAPFADRDEDFRTETFQMPAPLARAHPLDRERGVFQLDEGVEIVDRRAPQMNLARRGFRVEQGDGRREHGAQPSAALSASQRRRRNRSCSLHRGDRPSGLLHGCASLCHTARPNMPTPPATAAAAPRA